MCSPSKLGLVNRKGLFRGAMDVRKVNNRIHVLDECEQGEHG